MKRCHWRADADGVWGTDCGHLFDILEGTPAENGMRFCCYCGGSISDLPLRMERSWWDETPWPGILDYAERVLSPRELTKWLERPDVIERMARDGAEAD